MNIISPSQSAEHYTTTIIGGGMVGLTMAIALAYFNQAAGKACSIALIDINRHNVSQAPDGKCTALAKGTLDIFEQLGIRQFLPRIANNSIEHIHVSAKKRFGVSQLSANDFFDNDEQKQPSVFGHVLHNVDIINAMMQRLNQFDNIDFIAPAKVSDCKKQENGWSLQITSHNEPATRELTTDCLIISDGARSQLRKALGLPTNHHDYGFNAVACLVSTEKSHDNIAYERFLMPGTLAMLPTGKQQFGCVWTMPREDAQTLLSATQMEQEEQLQHAFGWRCGKLSLATELLQFPLHRIIASTQTIPHAFMLGNAAHNLHPVAGQGFNLSTRDAFILAELLTELLASAAHATNSSDSYTAVSKHYEAIRENDQAVTNHFSHLLPKLFDNTLPFSNLSRQTGLLAFDGLPVAAKIPFINQAMGNISHLPLTAKTNSPSKVHEA